VIIVDKLGKKVQLNNKLAIAEVTLNDSFNYVPKMSFATVIGINKKSLSIQYDTGCIDNDFISTEFVIISGEVINMTSYKSLQPQLEEHIYTKGFINV
jgi:hypothetical protein